MYSPLQATNAFLESQSPAEDKIGALPIPTVDQYVIKKHQDKLPQGRPENIIHLVLKN